VAVVEEAAVLVPAGAAPVVVARNAATAVETRDATFRPANQTIVVLVSARGRGRSATPGAEARAA